MACEVVLKEDYPSTDLVRGGPFCRENNRSEKTEAGKHRALLGRDVVMGVGPGQVCARGGSPDPCWNRTGVSLSPGSGVT